MPTAADECGLANLWTVVERSGVGGAVARGFPETLCGAIPALGPGLEAFDQQFVAIDLGATTLEAAAYRYGDRQTSVTTDAATGDGVDRAIVEAVAAETDDAVTIDRETARRYKETHADVDSSPTANRPALSAGSRETSQSPVSDSVDASP